MKRTITAIKLNTDYTRAFTDDNETVLYELSFKKGDIVPIAPEGDAIHPGAAAAMLTIHDAEPFFESDEETK